MVELRVYLVEGLWEEEVAKERDERKGKEKTERKE
jgi:hypothetical protein